VHSRELYGQYSSQNVIRVIKSRRMRWARHVACIGDKRGAYRVLVGRPEERRPLATPKRRWKGTIKLDFRDVGLKGVDLIDVAQGRDR
jgi:hypothetical protein